MAKPLSSLDALSEQVTTMNARLAVTCLVVGALALVLVTSPSLQRRLNERMRPLYADVIVAAVLIGTCLVTVSVTIAIWDLTEELGHLWDRYDLGGDVVARAIVSFLLVLTAYIVARFAKRVLRDVLDPASSVTDHQQEVTHRMTQVVIWSVAIVVVTGIWIDDLGGLLVGAGFLGIIVGMAARQTLGSMLAGFVLMFSRPFEIGDWIVIEAYEGIVTDISIVNTRIQTFDGEYVIVPNDVVGSNAVTNRSRRGRLRVEVDVGVDYAGDVERAAELAEETVSALDESIAAPAPRVVIKSFADSAVLLGVRFWIDRPSARRYAGAKTAAIAAIKRRFEAEGVKIPYPQRELSGRGEDGGFRVSDDHVRYDEADVDREPGSETGPSSEGKRRSMTDTKSGVERRSGTETPSKDGSRSATETPTGDDQMREDE